MEVLQKIETSSSLQSHNIASTVNTALDNPEIHHDAGATATTGNDHLLDDITHNTLLELQDMNDDHCMTSKSPMDDLILTSDDNYSASVQGIGDSVTVNEPSLADDSLHCKVIQSVVHDVGDSAAFNEPTSANDPIQYRILQSTDEDIVDSITVNEPNAAEDSIHFSQFVLEPTVQDSSPEVNVAINNVVCTFSTRCHLNLRHIALHGYNVELKKAQGMLNMKIRKPSATASIWSSGKITVTGANSEENCKIAARRIARKIQHIGFDVKFASFRIVNVLGTCSLPFGILLTDFSNENIGKVQYEPELHPGATYQIKDIHATLKIFSTGSITITAPKVENIQLAVQHVFPMVYPFKKPKKIDIREVRYMEQLTNGDSEAEVISDNSDLDLEPGEIPSTKSKRYSFRGRGQSVVRRQHIARLPHTVINVDDYGSSSEDAVDSDGSSD